ATDRRCQFFLMARSRKSLEEHWLKGSVPQYPPHTDSAGVPVQIVAARPKMPKDLPAVAQAEWKRLVKELYRRGVLTRVESSALEIYCRMFARWKAASEEVEKRGVLIETTWTDSEGTEHSKLIENPASKVAARLESNLRQMLQQFSATPASREKVK